MIHTKKLKGHDKNDIIIIYSKFEDIMDEKTIKENQELYGKFIIQWSCTHMVSQNGISVPIERICICQTYDDLKELGIRMITENSNIKKFKYNEVLFYYCKDEFEVNGVKPLS